MSPRLTIAIPTLNRSYLLARAIDSALAQTSPDIEILVSDNGSTDETAALIAGYSDPRLRTFRHESTMPAGRHGHFLIEQARGEFFVGLSDDDFLDPAFAAACLAAFDSHPETVFVYTGCAVHYYGVQVPAVVGPALEPGADLLLHHYSGQREISWCACVTRVRLLRQLGPQPAECVIGDMFFWTRMALLGPVGCVSRVLSHYILLREQNDNVSHGTAPAVWARESRALAEGALAGLQAAGAAPEFLAEFRAKSRDHVARSTANQFVWTRIRGAGIFQVLRWAWDCRHYLSFTWPAVSRLAAAVLLPRAVLKRSLLRSAHRMAESRTAALPPR